MKKFFARISLLGFLCLMGMPFVSAQSEEAAPAVVTEESAPATTVQSEEVVPVTATEEVAPVTTAAPENVVPVSEAGTQLPAAEPTLYEENQMGEMGQNLMHQDMDFDDMGMSSHGMYMDDSMMAILTIVSFVVFVGGIVMILLIVVAQCFIYSKAGQAWWKALIPIYNIFVFFDIINKSYWLILLLLVPLINIVMGVILAHRLARSFGKEVGFTIGLVLLPFIFYPILGFGSAKYKRLKD